MPRAAESRTATLVIINPSGGRERQSLHPLPFTIGRHADNHLVLRDNRASRSHARIVRESDEYVLEDCNSRHGTFVNGERIKRHKLHNSDRIDFGFQDSYKLIFTLEEAELHRIMEQISTPGTSAPAGNLAKLRALVEVARALQSSLSTEDVLAAVVDAALTVTGSERGFLLLRKEESDLDVAVARDNRGMPLAANDLQVPMNLINRALRMRRELLSMSFDPLEMQGVRPEMSVADLELRSVVCVPLIHIRPGSAQETIVSSVNDTIGLLYMDSRQGAADLSAGNRELLQTLALEASTILENARLLTEERAKQRMEEELNIAREIQKGLLPRELPSTGWFRAAGCSLASHAVGGDYFDVRPAGPDAWATVIADVSGKGVSSALLASLLQGAFLLASSGPVPIADTLRRVNSFLIERARGERYATVFYGTLERSGRLSWANAGHPSPILVRRGELIPLETTGMPLGLLQTADYEVQRTQLLPADKIVIYSDGLSEAENAENQFFDKSGLREVISANAHLDCHGLHSALLGGVEAFTEGAVPSDDITLVVLEFQPPSK